MAGAGVITDYLTVLSAQLPTPVMEELADGLDQTCQRYLGQGLPPAAAARAAIVEFGAPEVILAHFIQLSPARQAARRLLASGPVVGVLGSRSDHRSRLVLARPGHGPPAARHHAGRHHRPARRRRVRRRYRSIRRAGTAGCASLTALDAAMLLTTTIAVPAVAWPLILALAASAARLTFTAGLCALS